MSPACILYRLCCKKEVLCGVKIESAIVRGVARLTSFSCGIFEKKNDAIDGTVDYNKCCANSSECAHIPLLSKVVGVKRYEFFKLNIFYAQVINEVGKDTLAKTSQRIKTLEHRQKVCLQHLIQWCSSPLTCCAPDFERNGVVIIIR